MTFVGVIDIEVADDGDYEVTDSEPGDSEWEDDSTVHCYECKEKTTVKEAKEAWDKAHEEELNDDERQ